MEELTPAERRRMWRLTRAVVREALRPRREGGPRPERLEALRRGELPDVEEADRG